MRRLPNSVYYDLEALHTYGIDVAGRELFVSGEPESVEGAEGGEPGVEFLMSSKFIQNMRFLTRESDDPITIHLKTNGGYWEEGMAIHNTIALCPAHVTILNYTHARSMSSIIFQAADRRVMMPDSHFMFHLGTYAFGGTVRAVESTLDFSRSATPRMVNIYVKAIMESEHATLFDGWSEAKIRNRLHREMEKKEDVYLSAEEAVAWGLADEVFDGDWRGLKK